MSRERENMIQLAESAQIVGGQQVMDMEAAIAGLQAFFPRTSANPLHFQQDPKGRVWLYENDGSIAAVVPRVVWDEFRKRFG